MRVWWLKAMWSAPSLAMACGMAGHAQAQDAALTLGKVQVNAQTTRGQSAASVLS